MERLQSRPKSFGEVLDTTFSISKKHFAPLFLILLILLGPLYILNYLFMALSGVSIFGRQTDGGFTEGIMDNLDTAAATQEIVGSNMGPGGEILYMLLSSVLALVVYPMAQASIIVATSKVLKGEEWGKKQAVKGAFSRFWPLVGSSALLGLILGGGFFIGFLILGISGGMSFATAGAGPGLFMSIILAVLLLAALAFLATKWSMFFASVVFQKVAPGLSKSWQLTKRRFWSTLGLFVVFFIIIMLLTSIIEGLSVFLLGGSILGRIVTDVSTVITTLFLMVGYTVMYFDLKTRNEADDLEEMIASYKES
ncbi:hypothetical protein [Halobacillus litoralis]|uniref:DUF7847 domain-containing protein n=1 Tax=Halobacillus litoralis TaxID=45668 RepID=A0A410MEB7_9BACI|nr:hypothetical protein [Halobacillus litoralis]QAS53040.1 hypothetical protein HLI_13000 [Halobacillus litoralis]